MRIEYQTIGAPPARFGYERELPAGLFSRAAAAYLARMLAEELVGAGLVDRCRAAAYDDDGSQIVALEVAARSPGAQVAPGPPIAPGLRCVDCLAPVERGRPCSDCGGRASFDGAALGAELLEAAG